VGAYNKMKNINKLLLGMIFLAMLLPIVSASINSLGTFKSGECINLIQTCSDCSYNNITSILYPNSSQALGQVEMTKIGTEYNYTFCDTNTLGKYLVNGVGDTIIGLPTWNYEFEVTPTGSTNNLVIPIFLFIIGFILLIIGFIFKNEFFGLFSGMLLTATGVYTMIYGIGSLSDMYTRLIAAITLGFGLIVIFAAMFEIIKGEDLKEDLY
jgi:hypothetical protein